MLQKIKQPQALIGYLLLIISLAIFLIQIYRPAGLGGRNAFGLFNGAFFILYIISAGYFISIFVKHIRQFGWKKFAKGDEVLYAIALVLFSISAHSLNIELGSDIFASYPDWLTIYMIVMHVGILAFPYRMHMPEELQYLLYFVCGAGAIMCIYFNIYLAPLMAVSIPGALFLGISAHSFAPMFWLIQFIQAFFRMEDAKYSRTAYWAGVMVPILFLAIYLGRWHGVQKQIKEVQASYESESEQIYPLWVALSQQLPEGSFTEMVILGEATSHHLYSANWGNDLFGFSGRGMIHHNPLAVMAQLLYGKLELGRETMKALLNSRYDLRHMTHRRLWSGDDLETADVKTAIDIFPEYRIAYMEKTLQIHNDKYGTQEAVYSFYLPEGAIATSLSLWIEGEERKSRLTTKSKADSAYATIVGVESRDPALMHWQEGNRLSVTVFPCTHEEDRMFKIGLTIPLGYEDGKLSLGKVYFDGPPPASADEEIKIVWHGTAPANLDIPGRFEQEDEHSWTFEGSYLPYWDLGFDAPALSGDFFQFNHKRYSLSEITHEEQPLNLETVVLDLNAAWSWSEFKEVWEMVKDKKVMAYGPEPIELTDANHGEVYERLSKMKYSLLPIYHIGQSTSTLVISKGVHHAPILKDLEGSIYASRLNDWLMVKREPIRWMNLDNTLSPYVQTLKNFRILSVHTGDTEELKGILDRGSFPKIAESDNQIAISHAGISLTSTHAVEGEEVKGPDHLMRLYVYQDLLRRMGTDYFKLKSWEDFWVQFAEEAYIVTPVSSLVVLETREDYERFGIEENRNTLGNAKMANSGAVPEPHEWALIVLVLLIAVWQGKRRFGI